MQCQVKKDKVKDALYKLRSPGQQIESFVGDVVRAHVPKVRFRVDVCIMLRTCWASTSRALEQESSPLTCLQRSIYANLAFWFGLV